MAGDNYFITNQYTPYFLTCTVIRWIDVFTGKTYKDIMVESLNYCVQHMGKNDLWIAATASVLNAKLITTDKDFDHLDKVYFDLIRFEVS